MFPLKRSASEQTHRESFSECSLTVQFEMLKTQNFFSDCLTLCRFIWHLCLKALIDLICRLQIF